MKAIVLRERDASAEGKAKKLGAQVVVSEGWDLPAEQVLFVARGTQIPWTLVDAGFKFLEKWEMAAPLWRYGTLAKDIGGPAERALTEKATRDLRVLLYAHELLFVRKCPAGETFLAAWKAEMSTSPLPLSPGKKMPAERGKEPRLAFLRALYSVKPIFCALPQSWMPQILSVKEEMTLQQKSGAAAPSARHKPAAAGNMVMVEYLPGKFVRCREGQEEFMKERLRKLAGAREQRRG